VNCDLAQSQWQKRRTSSGSPVGQRLDVRREGVTEAATALKRRKLISYSRCNIAILDATRLNASSCSSYQIGKAVLDRAQL
jgi:hypothetical protein